MSHKEKTIVVVIDGAQSCDYETLSFPAMADSMHKISHTPKGRPTDSLNCIMFMLGVGENDIPLGRAYLEALSLDIPVRDNDLVFRCNGVDIKDGRLVSSTVARSFEAAGEGFEFHPMGGYKNLLIIKDKKACFEDITLYAPHENIGRLVEEIWPQSGDKDILDIIEYLYAQGFWVWGRSVKSRNDSFEELNGISGAMVCSTQIVKGIACALDMECPDIPGTTAEVDTSLSAKKNQALRLIEDHDYVMIHINGADEAAHRLNRTEKIDFMQRIDRELILPLIKETKGSIQLVVTSDHATDPANGSHVNEQVNTYMFNIKNGDEKWLRRL